MTLCPFHLVITLYLLLIIHLSPGGTLFDHLFVQTKINNN